MGAGKKPDMSAFWSALIRGLSSQKDKAAPEKKGK